MLALDLALIVRHSCNKFNLSLSTRGVAFTLAFRIGTNSCSWVSQKCLAEELGIDERNVRQHCNKLKKVGILLIKKDTDDKRKNLYSFTPTIFNYAQMNDEDRKKCRMILSGNMEDTGQKHPVNTGQKHPVLNCPSDTQTIENKQEKTVEKLPKRKIKEHKEHKEKKKPVDNFEIPSWLNKEDWDEFKEFRKEIKKPLSRLAEKKALNKLIKLKEAGNCPKEILEESIINNWKGLFEIKKSYSGINKSNEVRSMVKDWAPGNPDYDRVNNY